MSLLRLSVVNVLGMWRRFVGLAALVAVGACVSVAGLTLADDAQAVARHRVDDTAALRAVEITHLAARSDVAALTTSSLEKVRRMAHVRSVEPSVQATIGYKSARIPGALLYATIARPSQAPPLVAALRRSVFPLAGDEIVVPSRAQGQDLSSLLGQRIQVDYQRTVRTGEGTSAHDTVRVVGLYDPSWQWDGPDAAYVSRSRAVAWAAARAGLPEAGFLDQQGYDKALVVADSPDHVPAVMGELQGAGYAATSMRQQLEALPATLRLVQSVGRLAFGLLVGFVLLGAAALTGALVRQRTREIGLLKAVGFQDRAVLVLFLVEMALVGLAAAGVGLLLSVPAGQVLRAGLDRVPELHDFLPGGLQVPAGGLSLGVLVMVTAGMALGALLPARRGSRLDPVDALRDW